MISYCLQTRPLAGCGQGTAERREEKVETRFQFKIRHFQQVSRKSADLTTLLQVIQISEVKSAARSKSNSRSQSGIFTLSLSASAESALNPRRRQVLITPSAPHQDCEASPRGADRRQESADAAFTAVTAPNNAELSVGGEADEQLFVTNFLTRF